jgi:hypothetical protein
LFFLILLYVFGDAILLILSAASRNLPFAVAIIQVIILVPLVFVLD